MFCPSCKYEYREGITECPDCQKKLVGKLEEIPEFKDMPDIPFVPLPNLPGRVFAEMVKNVLEEKGIPCYIQADGIGNAYQLGGTMPLGGVQLFVPENRLEECLQVQHDMMDHI